MPAPTSHLANVTNFFRRLPVEAQAVGILISSGLVGPERPDRLRGHVPGVRPLRRHGGVALPSPPSATVAGPGWSTSSAALTFAEMDRRSNVVANALRAGGLGPGDGVGILCRNHRGMYDASYGVLKAGARALYLNTDFAGPQAAEVCAREGVHAVIYDEEFAEVVAGIDAPKGRFVAWTDGQAGRRDRGQASESLIAPGRRPASGARSAPGSVVILTSGTTGLPKGANRAQPRSLSAAAAILSRIPLRARESTFIAPPLYHAWGLGMSILAIGLGSTMVVRRRFDAGGHAGGAGGAALHAPWRSSRSCSTGCCRSGRTASAASDLSGLRIVASSGAQLEAAVATRAMDAFGDVVYNLYGSTEVAWATIATPADLRAAPGCAGRPPLGTTVRILDDDGDRAPDRHDRADLRRQRHGVRRATPEVAARR